MPKIEVSVKIRGPRDKVYKIIKDMENFPHFMREVKNLKIIKRMDNALVTAWEIEVDGAPVNWKEEDYFDDANYQVRFNMLEGNYEEYQGRWLLQDISRNHTRLTLEADFDWGIPILEKHVSKALEDKARRSLLGMIQAIKKKAERADV
jgi:ribosome-associated toxin RatA of RatAB toxin-antitoxin module